jgi:shikimate kinase
VTDLSNTFSNADFLKGVNLYLIGMMGVGKTTVGKLLAAKLNYRFFDTDAVIEQAANQSIAQIFAESGEDSFRQLETQVLSELCAYKRLVIATGGGIVLRRENWSYLRHGIVLWLDVPLEQLHQRLRSDTTRPLLQTPDWADKLQSLMEQRQSLYAQADVHIQCGGSESPAAIVDRALIQIQQALKPDLDTSLN